MLDEQGNAILADFGLALLTEVGTQVEILGSPHHIAPEQAISSANVVPQTDLYAVGVILYEMLTGEIPFDAPDPLGIAMLHMTEPPPLPRELRPDLSPELEAVLLRALAKSPEERYPTGAVLADALDEALQSAPAEEATSPALSSPPAPDAQEDAQLPPMPAAVAPRPTEPMPEPPSITSIAGDPSPTPAMPTVLSRLRGVPEGGRHSLVYIIAGACIILLILLAVVFLLVRSSSKFRESKTEDTPTAGVAEIVAPLGADSQPTQATETVPVTQSTIETGSLLIQETVDASDSIVGATETPTATEPAPETVMNRSR